LRTWRDTPGSVGESAEWAAIVNAGEENGASYCKGLHGKPLFSALYSTYTVTLDELKDLLKASTLTGQQTTQEDGFQEVQRKKRRTTDETVGTLFRPSGVMTDIYCGMYVKKHWLLGYVTVKSEATIEYDTLCQRSTSYSRNNRTVGSGVFCTDRVLSNIQYAVKGK
jgi:hypothetical protein